MADLTVTSKKIISWTEKRSKENLVGMYKQEILRVADGVRCSDLIPRGVRRRLMREGILKKLGNKYFVTNLGIKMIREGTFSKEGLNAEM